MIRGALCFLLASCLLSQAPALANTADTDWLLEEIRSQLKNLTTIRALANCPTPLQCIALDDHSEGREFLSAAPYPPRFSTKQFPTPDHPWFIDIADNGHNENGNTRCHSDWCDYTYQATSLMQTVRSLSRMSPATFWEREEAALFPTPEQLEFAGAPRLLFPQDTRLGKSKRRRTRISAWSAAFRN